MLKNLKRQQEEEKKSISKIKRLFPHLSNMSKKDLLHYFNCMSSSELIKISYSLSEIDSLSHKKDKDENICKCKDANGVPKTLYETQDEAEQVKTYVYNERKVRLAIYTCPISIGWHLSKV